MYPEARSVGQHPHHPHQHHASRQSCCQGCDEGGPCDGSAAGLGADTHVHHDGTVTHTHADGTTHRHKGGGLPHEHHGRMPHELESHGGCGCHECTGCGKGLGYTPHGGGAAFSGTHHGGGFGGGGVHHGGGGFGGGHHGGGHHHGGGFYYPDYYYAAPVLLETCVCADGSLPGSGGNYLCADGTPPSCYETLAGLGAKVGLGDQASCMSSAQALLSGIADGSIASSYTSESGPANPVVQAFQQQWNANGGSPQLTEDGLLGGCTAEAASVVSGQTVTAVIPNTDGSFTCELNPGTYQAPGCTGPTPPTPQPQPGPQGPPGAPGAAAPSSNTGLLIAAGLAAAGVIGLVAMGAAKSPMGAAKPATHPAHRPTHPTHRTHREEAFENPTGTEIAAGVGALAAVGLGVYLLTKPAAAATPPAPPAPSPGGSSAAAVQQAAQNLAISAAKGANLCSGQAFNQIAAFQQAAGLTPSGTYDGTTAAALAAALHQFGLDQGQGALSAPSSC